MSQETQGFLQGGLVVPLLGPVAWDNWGGLGNPPRWWQLLGQAQGWGVSPPQVAGLALGVGAEAKWRRT